ncbi:MAG: DUF6056 family protein [Bacteroidales bacterium]|nr:DUF6056 family protein [Lachnoclostridium sp.]MCM1385311.1 DUF6056 family protein [Lachnoclostridium sp.]MCM1465511.1 DUF6056 family protein [Bacteroidales bacterium]
MEIIINMNKVLSAIKKNQEILFCIAAVGLLIVICIPLFMVAKYNYMSADDFGYGSITHHAIQNGQPWKIFGLAAQQAMRIYFTWQGSFSAIFLFALQPGIWGEQYYQLGIYIIIFFLAVMQFILLKRINGGAGEVKIGRKCLIGLIALLLLVQILYVPYPEECFYWFNGGLYYTFFYTLQMLFFSEIIILFGFPSKLRGKQILFYCWMLFLAIVIGGGNLGTALSTILTLCLLTVLLLVKKEEHRFHVLAITVVFFLAFLANIAAPGNAVRAQDPGYHINSPVMTVLLSLWHCMINVYSWTNYKMWLILLIAFPLLWKMAGVITKNWKFRFRFPAIATVFLFGIYASQLAPISYMEGTFGPKRMGDMMWYSYVWWLFSVEMYWIGWFRCRFSERKVFAPVKSFLSRYYGIMQICCLALWCVSVLLTDVRGTGAYKAWAAVRSGEAGQYALENEERLAVLQNPEIKDVYFYEIEHRVEPIFVFDITENNQNDSNTSMARFYDKNTVNLIVDE